MTEPSHAMHMNEEAGKARPNKQSHEGGWARKATDEALLGLVLEPRGTPTEQARCGCDWLKRHGSVRAVLRHARAGAAGLDPLLAAAELIRRNQFQKLARGPAMTHPGRVREFLHESLRDRSREAFACLFLDARHHVVAYEELFEGGLDGAQVHAGVVARRALLHRSSAVIVAHNHPSGATEPSDADRLMTARLTNALSLLDIRLLDHFIIGDGKPVSMASRGWIERERNTAESNPSGAPNCLQQEGR